MSIFSKIFRKDHIKMVDVKDTSQEKPFITKNEEKKMCTSKSNNSQNPKRSPFLDDCDE